METTLLIPESLKSDQLVTNYFTIVYWKISKLLGMVLHYLHTLKIENPN